MLRPLLTFNRNGGSRDIDITVSNIVAADAQHAEGDNVNVNVQKVTTSAETVQERRHEQ